MGIAVPIHCRFLLFFQKQSLFFCIIIVAQMFVESNRQNSQIERLFFIGYSEIMKPAPRSAKARRYIAAIGAKTGHLAAAERWAGKTKSHRGYSPFAGLMGSNGWRFLLRLFFYKQIKWSNIRSQYCFFQICCKRFIICQKNPLINYGFNLHVKSHGF